jgi:hypothetical protein
MAKNKKPKEEPKKQKELPPNKQLKQMLEGAGRILSAKEVKKIAEATGFTNLKIAKEAAETATKAGTTTQFSAKLGKKLSKEAKTLIPKQKPVVLPEGGSLNSGYGVYREFAARVAEEERLQQIRKNLKEAGLRPGNQGFVQSLTELPKYDKGQLYSTGISGVGSVIPRDALKVKTQRIIEETGSKQEAKNFRKDLKSIVSQSTQGMSGLSESDQAYLDAFSQIFSNLQPQFNQLNQQQSAFDQMLANFSNSMQGISQMQQQGFEQMQAAMSSPRLYGAGQNYNVGPIRTAQSGAYPMGNRSDYMRSQGMGISSYPSFGYGVNV